MIRARQLRAVVFAPALLLLGGLPVLGQTRGAVLVRQPTPAYPESLSKTQQQGNVLLIGRIDTEGHVQNVVAVGASYPELQEPAVQAVRTWEFRPALRDGKPIELFLNAATRFRIPGDRRGDVPWPILGDLAIQPADASGKATAPDGFPLRLGKDPALRADAVLDVPPIPAARTLGMKVEARSPSGKMISVFQPPVAVAANAAEVKIPVVVPIGSDWEEGVWGLLFTVDGRGAGGGQFWLARDPTRFPFVSK